MLRAPQSGAPCDRVIVNSDTLNIAVGIVLPEIHGHAKDPTAAANCDMSGMRQMLNSFFRDGQVSAAANAECLAYEEEEENEGEEEEVAAASTNGNGVRGGSALAADDPDEDEWDDDEWVDDDEGQGDDDEPGNNNNSSEPDPARHLCDRSVAYRPYVAAGIDLRWP